MVIHMKKKIKFLKIYLRNLCQVWTDMETWGFCLLCSGFSEAICGRFWTAVRSLFILSLLALGIFMTLFGEESGSVMFRGSKEGIALDFRLGSSLYVWFCSCFLLVRVFGICIFSHYPDHIQTDNSLWYPRHVLCSAPVLPCIAIRYSIQTDCWPAVSHTWRLLYICRQWSDHVIRH